MTNLKNITDLPMLDSINNDINLIINDNGLAKQLNAAQVLNNYDLIIEFTGREDMHEALPDQIKPIDKSYFNNCIQKLNRGESVRILWKHHYKNPDNNGTLFCHEQQLTVKHWGSRVFACGNYTVDIEGMITLRFMITFDENGIIAIDAY